MYNILSMSNLYNFSKNIYSHAPHLTQIVFELTTFVILFKLIIKHKITVIHSLSKKLRI